MTGEKPRDTQNPLVSKRRPLPTDPGEFESAVSEYRVLAKPLVDIVSAVCDMLKTKPLSSPEKSSGETAFAAVLYEHQAKFGSEMFLGLWAIGITLPRLMEYLETRKDKETQTKNGAQVLPTPPLPTEVRPAA